MRSRSATGDEWWRLMPPGTSDDALRVLAARGVRAFGDGFVALLLPIYLVELGFSPLAIGAIVTSTLIGTALLTLWVGWVANRYSRRLLLFAAALLMAATGAGFAMLTDFWPLLVIAFVGTMNPTSGDASIFVPLEQTVLTKTIAARQRTALFARYSVIGSLRDGAWRARGSGSRSRHGVDGLHPHGRYAADVWPLCGVGAARAGAVPSALAGRRDRR